MVDSILQAGNPVKEILLKLNLPDHRLILTDSKVTPTKHGRMTKPYSSPYFIANCFNARYLKMEVKTSATLKDKEFQRSFCHSDIERLSRSDEVLKLKNFKKDATLKLFKSTNQERLVVVDGSDRTERGYQGRLGVVADESMVGPIMDEIAEPIVEAEEQMIATVVDIDEDLAMLFGDDEFEDDDSEGFDEEEVWEVNEESTVVAEGQSFPLPAPGLPIPPSVIEDLSTRLGNLEYEHRQLVTKVIQMSYAKVSAGVTIGEIGPRIFAIEGHVQVMVSQMVHAAYRFEQIGTHVEHDQQIAA
ncbi:hypothetical protein Tco_0906347 [Tanacetum coccineum]|uniref:Uncharacterized protein n=1 Tax=Tanacetum coccineum TaxID=301880 RepID=A0ABQ5CIY6_9ASTR